MPVAEHRGFIPHCSQRTHSCANREASQDKGLRKNLVQDLGLGWVIWGDIYGNGLDWVVTGSRAILIGNLSKFYL